MFGYTATLNPLLLETAEEFQQAYKACGGQSPSIKVPGSAVWVRGEPGNSWFYVISRGYGKPDGKDSHAPLMDQEAAWQLHCQHHHRHGMCDKSPEAVAVHQAILALDKKALPSSLRAGESAPQAAGTRRFFTRPEAKAKIGTPVRSRVDFAGVPCGTRGQVIDEHLADPLARPRGYKVSIEWDLPRSQWKSVPGGSRPWIDWFDRCEYVCSLAEMLVRDPQPN
jgi:hypothetical protein